MGRIRRGGYLFVTWMGDHPPRHVHVFRDDELVLRWNLEAKVPMTGQASRKILKIIEELVAEGTSVKVRDVSLDNRRKAFLLEIEGHGTLSFPYAKADPPPTRDDPVEEVFVDPELGREGVTYRLASGGECSVLADHVLDYHRDPAYMRDLLLHQLTVEALRRVEDAPIGIREISRRLKTSPAQVYRLLDTTNYRKTVDRMLELLQVLDARVELRVD